MSDSSRTSPGLPPPHLTRRTAFRALACGGAGVALWLGSAGRAAASPPGPRRVTFHNTHTLESLSVEYCRDGAYCDPALAAVNQVLRDHRSGEVHAIDPGLLDLLSDLAIRCEKDPEFEVISGYRSPETNAAMHARSTGVAAHSLHMEGRAIDIRLVGCELGAVRDAGLALGRGGVGYYQASQFVHLDTGRVRRWVG
ncbi:MAG TPA: DUF882 domain-containing protein [Steroidobacteraceae bacterium]|nr:DUF882 domain-containing protein [Steroidobacteraceae bacterium]